MKIRILSVFILLSLSLGLLCGCTVTAEIPALDEVVEATTTVVFSGDHVSITGSGATLDGNDVLIAQSGIYELTGTCENGRVIVKADDTADVTLILSGVNITNPADEAIYFKVCGSASVILADGTENTLTGGTEDTFAAATASETETDEQDSPSGAALRALCAMTLQGEGSLTVNGYINNGIAADGGLTVLSGTYDVTAANDGLKSDGDVSILGGSIAVSSLCDGVQAGGTLDITAGTLDVYTGAGSAGAEMKVSDSLFMAGGMGGMGGRGSRASAEASTEASGEAENTDTVTAASSEAGDALETEILLPETTETTEAADTQTAPSAEMTGETTSTEPSREMPGGMPGGMEFNQDADDSGDPSRKGLKAGTAIVIAGGDITVDAQDDAIHSDGSLTITGGNLTLRSGDDGVHGETTLQISGGYMDVLYCYEGLEATAILISDGWLNITATDDGMNAGGMGMGMGMMPGMGGRFASGEASGETETTDATASDEADNTADADVTASDEAETVETIVRITGGTVIVNSGGDGLDSNASMYIEGGTVFVSGPSSNWDSPIDYGEGSSELIISGGSVMVAGYTGMFESPDISDVSQGFIYYTQNEYAPDGGVTRLTAADGTVLAEYAFANSYNGVLISTPDITAGETYTLTIDGTDATIEMTTAQYSTRGSSGEMGGPGGRR